MDYVNFQPPNGLPHTMRLLNAKTVQLEEFPDNAIPQYAILSHTWGKEEASFQDMQSRRSIRRTVEKAGYRKIEYSCNQAVKDLLTYVWVDTCCIDKSSSAELSEAINSMYRWYSHAAICYAYLTDIPANDNPEAPNSAFVNSRWFTRGWTLQELIAPPRVVFYAQNWTKLGTKEDLCHSISRGTGIDVEVLERGGRAFRSFSIAQRMSWASRRTTTREEDIAYCLLGIFNVNMPILYGEREKAFIRLQEEIMKYSDDQSLFAWGIPQDNQLDFYFEPEIRGLLAKSPAEFANSGDIISYQSTAPYAMTNKGIQIELPIWKPNPPPSAHFQYWGLLSCHIVDNFFDIIGIPLQHRPFEDDQYKRIGSEPPKRIRRDQLAESKYKAIYVREETLPRSFQDYRRRHGFQIRSLPDPDSGYQLAAVLPDKQWNSAQRIIRRPVENKWQAIVLFEGQAEKHFIVSMGVVPRLLSDTKDRPWCAVAFNQTGVPLEAVMDEDFSHRQNECTKNLPCGQRLSVKISTEDVIGEEMFVVDIDVYDPNEWMRMPID